ncbi:MAG: hypothetical protein ACPG4Q_06115, partial [Phycisphaeraceae bacterium]
MRKTSTLFTTAALLSVAGLAHAQITVESVFSFADNNADNSEGVGVFNASSYDKLIVIVTGEHGFPNNTSGINITGVSYDGIDMSAAVIRDGLPEVDNVSPDQAFNHIYYLDDPLGTTGTIQVNTNLSRFVVTAIGLDGAAAGVGATAIAGLSTKSVDLTTTSANSFVIASNGLGGTGNNGNVDGLTVNSPLSLLGAVETNSNYSGHVIGGATVATAGTDSYSFTGSTAGSHVIAAEFLLGLPPAVLTLQANTTNGLLTLIGDSGEPISFNYYEITSAGDSLTTSGWNSLADQDFDGNGPANGTGNGWEEAGGSNASSLAEAYLLGNSEIAANQQVLLGKAYDTSVDTRDLTMRFLTDTGKIRDATVEYFSPVMGDADNDGDVDNADLGAAAGNFTGSSGSGKNWATGDFDADGDTDNADIGVVAGGFTGAQAGNLTDSGNIADLRYDPTTGNITLDASEA